jgi:alkylhydroperoxidase family enzyme
MPGNHAIHKPAFAETSQAVQNLLAATVERQGYFGEMFAYLSHTPEALAGFMQYSGALRSDLPARLNELIALAVCARLDFAYERIQHERLSLKLDLDREWIAALTGHGPMVALDPAETAAHALAEAVANGDTATASTALNDLAAASDDRIAIAALLQATRFVSVCVIGRTLGVTLPVPSIFGEATE